MNFNFSRLHCLKPPDPRTAMSSPSHGQKQQARKQNQVELISKIMAAAHGCCPRHVLLFWGGGSGCGSVYCRWQQGRRQAGRSKKTVTEHINLLTDASCVPLARLDWTRPRLSRQTVAWPGLAFLACFSPRSNRSGQTERRTDAGRATLGWTVCHVDESKSTFTPYSYSALSAPLFRPRFGAFVLQNGRCNLFSPSFIHFIQLFRLFFGICFVLSPMRSTFTCFSLFLAFSFPFSLFYSCTLPTFSWLFRFSVFQLLSKVYPYISLSVCVSLFWFFSFVISLFLLMINAAVAFHNL